MSTFSSKKLDSAKEILEQSQLEKEPYYIKVCGVNFKAHPQVFSPKYFKNTELMNPQFPFRENERFLEIGCGIGITSILAALHHQNQVVCGDINPYAVECAKKNAELNSVTHLVDARETDLFSAIEKEEQFDTIFWDLPFVYVPEDYRHSSILEKAVCDPGYGKIEKFLKQAPEYLKENGRLLVEFGSNGEFDIFKSVTDNLGYEIEEVVRVSITEREGLSYMLFDLKKI